MYHIIYNLERMFTNLEECQNWLDHLILYPDIPSHRMPEEDNVTPRICVAESVEACITGIGVPGVFKRCCKSNGSVYCGCSNEQNAEAYPIAVIQLDDNLEYRKPTKEEVPDVEEIGEYWLLDKAIPVKAEVRWLDAHSIELFWSDECCEFCVCDSVWFLNDLTGYSHPWLNGLGHTLDGRTLDCMILPKTAEEKV